MSERKHHHNLGCRNEPELGWACHYTEEERYIFRLEALADLARRAKVYNHWLPIPQEWWDELDAAMKE